MSKPVIIQNADNILNVINPNDFLSEIAEESSKKAVGWLFINNDENGELIYRVMDSNEIIPIYDTQYQDKLVHVIRYYSIYVVEGKTTQQRYKVEVWDSEQVKYYSEVQAETIFLIQT